MQTMNRRSFVGALATMPLVARLPAEPNLIPRAERRFESPMGDFGAFTVEVEMALTERIARGVRNREAHDPFDGQVGEFYIDSSRRVVIPDHLPGTITTYSTVVGVAAQRGTVHVGGFRRTTFVWTVRVHGGPADYAIEAAEEIADVALPDAHRVLLVPSLLNDLLPVPEHFSRPVEISTE